jgi:holo-[acyl-carrier protein] synthase
MILGLGTDIVSVADMARRIERGSILRVFSNAELGYADRRPDRRAEVLAARWAAREAFLKAVGTGYLPGMPLRQLAVVRDDRGCPTFDLGPRMRKLLPAGAGTHLSMSHTPEYATAVVVVSRD